jgi:hypothetical protein
MLKCVVIHELIGNSLAISNKSEIIIGSTPVPFLTAPLIHQNSSVGRLCGVVEVVTQPVMTITKSMYKDHENGDVAKVSFNAKLNDGSIAEISIWGSLATSAQAHLIQQKSHLLIIRALAKLDGNLSISPRLPTATDSAPNQPSVMVLSEHQTVTHVADLDIAGGMESIKTMKMARLHSVQTRALALQTELATLLKDYDAIILET